MPVGMRDGTTLISNVYRPAGGGDHPSPGHRARVEITSSPHSRRKRNLNTSESVVRYARPGVDRQTIFQDAARPSRVTLTVVEG